jgi:hypothetical protein
MNTFTIVFIQVSGVFLYADNFDGMFLDIRDLRYTY